MIPLRRSGVGARTGIVAVGVAPAGQADPDTAELCRFRRVAGLDAGGEVGVVEVRDEPAPPRRLI
ncbi:hypothetical protein, partial [Rhodococcoides kroppenstedtii]|uniref:hypothetical protein n=1 Tax=Rhodococcoides kroppenstedtii TaxID=293050 RepID=UPI001B809D54